jgi:hypothetical protein
LVGTFEEAGQATAVLSAWVATVVLAGSRAIRGSWRTAEWAWWMFVAALAEVNARRIDLAAEQTEVVQTLDFVVVRGMTRKCLCVTCLVEEAH